MVKKDDGRDRYSIDLTELRERLEACRDDVSWEEMPLSVKIRVLLRERVEQLEAELAQRHRTEGRSTFRNFSELIWGNWDNLTSYGRISIARLQQLRDGEAIPTELEVARIAIATRVDEQCIEKLVNQEKEPNGT